MKRNTSGNTGMTIEEFEFGADLLDLEINIAFTVIPGEPEVRYLRNGDPGYPASPAELDGVTLTVESATAYDEDGNDRTPTPQELLAIQVELNRRYHAKGNDKLRDAIDQRCFDDAAEQDDGPDPDDARDAWLDRRDERERDWENAVGCVD